MRRDRRPLSAALCLTCLVFLIAMVSAHAQNATDWSGTKGIDSVEERRVLASLKKEREKLQRKKESMAKREKELKVLQQEVEKKLKQLRQWRGDLEELLAEKKQKEQKRVQKLSRIYQRMDPGKAAAALGSVKRDLAVNILSRMRSGTAAEVLNSMDKKQAATLSTDLSELEVPEEE